MGPKPENLAGVKVNGITFLRFSHRNPGPKGARFWVCRCRCGKEFTTRSSSVKSGHTNSCGCALKRFLASGNARLSHGHAVKNGKRSAEYQAWARMIQRCTNPNDPKFPDYGGRGIVVCDRWRTSFADFLADVGNRPGKGYTIHRVNNNGHYEPNNCTWANAKEQARNRRSSRYVKVNGKRITLAEAAESHGLTLRQLWSRLNYGWSIERALSEPLRQWGPGKPLAQS